MSEKQRYDLIVIGSGPAGQKAAIQAAKSRKSVAVVESETAVGGACVHHGTIPSKTLREIAARVSKFKRDTSSFRLQVKGRVEMASLLQRMESVIASHHRFIGEQLRRNGVRRIAGRAGFVDPHSLDVLQVGGKKLRFTAEHIVIATGSHPRSIPGIPVDHEHVLDSDSILSMSYLPDGMLVIGGGVIAIEYASIFASLGVQVTVLDRQERPLTFVDAELVDHLLQQFEALGGRYLPSCEIDSLRWDGVQSVVATLSDGSEFRGDHALVALGREANVRWLQLDKIGVELTPRGHIRVDEHFRTCVENVYAVGDVIGPPALASTAMEQGRRAACHAMGMPTDGESNWLIPAGIYAVPEIATVGLSEAEARHRHGSEIIIGRAQFEEVARGQISGCMQGLLKLIVAPDGDRILGVSIVGDGATELIHIGQMALIGGMDVDALVANTFNFPTLAEAYRVAALKVLEQRSTKRESAPHEVGAERP